MPWPFGSLDFAHLNFCDSINISYHLSSRDASGAFDLMLVHP